MRAYAKRRTQSRMGFDVFQECIKSIPSDVTIAFAGMAEPWLNPECTRMVQWAHKTGHRVLAYTTAVGMSPKDVEALADIPSLYLLLHLPSAEGYERIAVDDSYLSVPDSLLDSGIVDHCHCYGTAVHPLIGSIGHEGAGGSRAMTRIRNVRIEYERPQARAGNVQIGDASARRKRGRRRCVRN